MLALGKKNFTLTPLPEFNRQQSRSTYVVEECLDASRRITSTEHFWGNHNTGIDSLLSENRFSIFASISVLNTLNDWMPMIFVDLKSPLSNLFIHRFQESFWASKDNPGGDHKAFDMENEQLIRERKHYSQTPLSSKPYSTGFLLLV